MAKKKNKLDFYESTEDFMRTSLTGAVNQDLFGLYQLVWKHIFGPALLKEGHLQLGMYKTALPFFIAVDEFKFQKSLLNIVLYDASRNNNNWGLDLENPKPLNLMQLYYEEGFNQSPHFKEFNDKLQSMIENELAGSVYTIYNVIDKATRIRQGNGVPVYNYLKSKDCNLLRSELGIINPDAIVIMGQSKSVDAILRDSLGPYTAVNIPEIPRVRRLFWEGIDCPVIQTPNALYVAVMDMTQELIAYLKGFFIQELTNRLKGPFKN